MPCRARSAQSTAARASRTTGQGPWAKNHGPRIMGQRPQAEDRGPRTVGQGRGAWLAYVDADVGARDCNRPPIGRVACDKLVEELAGCEGLRPSGGHPRLINLACAGKVGADETATALQRAAGKAFLLLHPVPARVPRFVLGRVGHHQIDLLTAADGTTRSIERVDAVGRDTSDVHLMHSVGAGQ